MGHLATAVINTPALPVGDVALHGVEVAVVHAVGTVEGMVTQKPVQHGVVGQLRVIC